MGFVWGFFFSLKKSPKDKIQNSEVRARLSEISFRQGLLAESDLITSSFQVKMPVTKPFPVFRRCKRERKVILYVARKVIPGASKQIL